VEGDAPSPYLSHSTPSASWKVSRISIIDLWSPYYYRIVAIYFIYVGDIWFLRLCHFSRIYQSYFVLKATLSHYNAPKPWRVILGCHWGSTMTATNHDNQLGEICPTMLNEPNRTLGVIVVCGHRGMWPSWYVAIVVCGHRGMWPSFSNPVPTCWLICSLVILDYYKYDFHKIWHRRLTSVWKSKVQHQNCSTTFNKIEDFTKFVCKSAWHRFAHSLWVLSFARDVTDSESASECDGIRHFFKNPT